MTLSEIKQLLADHGGLHFRIRLPDGGDVPLSFHVTEVGRVHKTFLDCGGTLRESITCQLQIWVGPDYDHRLETGKMAAILGKAASYLPDENIPVEMEYEDKLISQYTISGHSLEDGAVVLHLSHKHTECLAPELCGLPPLLGAGKLKAPSPPCGPRSCC
jgi:hypothetical protein